MKISANGKALIRESEGLRLKAYADPATGGKPWGIGYGHVRGVMPGQTCTKLDAERWLEEDIAVAEAAIRRLVKVPLRQHEYDALIDFVFNLGETRFSSSTLLQRLNGGDKSGAGDEFQRWVYADHKILRGLVTRSRRRTALWFSEPATIVEVSKPQPNGPAFGQAKKPAWGINLWRRIWG